jgi:hypothetical protein
MSAASFQVALTGLKDGHAPEDVAHRLARLFTQPHERMLSILDGQRRILKKGLSEADAKRYEAALHGAGCTCTVSTLPARGARDIVAATTSALAAVAARAEHHRAKQTQLAQTDLAAGQRLFIDAIILHGIYLVLLRHLSLTSSLILWLPVVAVMSYGLFRLSHGLGYPVRQRNLLTAAMFIPLAGLATLAALSFKAYRAPGSDQR